MIQLLINIRLKILWIESNYDYIMNIVEVYNILSFAVKKEEKSEKSFFEDIYDYIRKRNVRYFAQNI